jgi:hypothetical protein
MQRPRLYSFLLLGLCAALFTLLTACKGKPDQLFIFTPDANKPLAKDFSASKAMAHVAAQVACGPRPAGSEALGKCRAFLKKELEAAGWEVQEQAFKNYTPKGDVDFVNLRARLPRKDSDTWTRPCTILLGSHYDTKLFGSFEFLGANDGGSSTGVLLEMGRVLGARPDAGQSVELVFFDGEEASVNYTMDVNTRLPDDGLYGSRYYANMVRKLPIAQKPLFFILLDMVGDKDLKIELPANVTESLAELVLTAAGKLDYSNYFGRRSGEILDDHHPFLVSGIPSVDIIDLDFKPWHTALDKMAAISPQSLDIVGKTTLQVVEALLSAQPL